MGRMECYQLYRHKRAGIDNKKGPEGPFYRRGCHAQSRSPPKMPSKASKFWNTFTMFRYSDRVAVM